MKTLPPTVAPYKRTPDFTEATVPAGLLKDHSTKEGVWGAIRVTAGQLRYVIPSRNEQVILDPETVGIVEPEVSHRVEPLGAVTFYVDFYR